MEKKAGIDLASHLEWIEEFIHGRLEEIPNDYLRFGDNQAQFFLLILLGDLAWHYRINGLHLKTRVFHYYNRYCLCD